MNGVVQWLEARSEAAKATLGVATLAVVAGVDVLTGWELSLALFYLIPVMIVAFLGRRSAVAAAFASALAWWGADSWSGRVYSRPELAYWNAAVRFGVFLVVGVLTAELLRESRRQRESARVDSLTGVANSLGFFERGELERKRMGRSGLPAALAYLDVDHFKEINDTAGHAAGDRVLAALGRCLRSGLRATDVVARLGGDEFVVILPETERDVADRVLSKIVREAENDMGREYPNVRLTVGLVVFTAPPDTLDAMVRAGDDLMYEAKSKGRNRIEVRVLGAAGEGP